MITGLSQLERRVVVALIMLMLGLLRAATADAAVRAYLEPPSVYEGDQVTLVIEADGLDPSGQPDFAPLHDDFDVGGVSTSRQTQIINGRRSDQTAWRVALLPKGVGAIEVPAIAVGSERTEPLELNVQEPPQGQVGAPGDQVWVELALEADTDQLVVQQQVPLVVRAYSARPVLDYELRIPTIDGAVLTQIGRDTGRITTRGGTQYRVIERRFTLSPERSGELRIPPVSFEAELKPERGTAPDPMAGGRPRNLFDDPMIERMFDGMPFGRGFSMFERGELARAQTQARTLEVAPSAAGFSGDAWIPAAQLQIQDSWSLDDGGEPPLLAVGEPATRTLTLTAKGLSGNQIPDLDIPVPAGMRAYPEKTESETRTDGATVIGVSRQQITLIPTSGGAVDLPEIRVPWWDTEAGQEREAVVAPMRLQVAGAIAPPRDDGPGAEVSSSQAQPSGGEGVAPPSAPDAEASPGTIPRDGSSASWGTAWLWALAGGLLLAAVAAYVWRRYQGARRASILAAPRPATGASQALQRVRQACERGDGRGTAKALIGWAAVQWPEDPPSNLAALAARIPSAAAPIGALERHLYAPGAAESAWDGDALWRALKDGCGGETTRASRANDELAPLYPLRS